MVRYIYILLATFVFGSCSYVLDMKRTGDEKKIEVTWNGASTIEVWAPCNLILVNSDSSFIEVEGMDFIVDGYDWIQSEEKLIIEHKHTNWLQEKKIATVTLGAPDFKRVTFNSPGKINSLDTLKISQFQIVVNGKGIYTTSEMNLKGNHFSLSVYGGINKSNHHLAGVVKNAHYTMEGGTDINALELSSESVTVIQKSYGNIFLNATENLNTKTYSTGNIYYSGNPVVEAKTIKSTVMRASGKVLPY